MDDVVRIVDLLSEKTKEFSDLYTKLEGELAQTLGAEGGLKDEYTASATTIKGLKDEKKALKNELTGLNKKSYKVGSFEKLDWAEYQVIISKLGLTDEAVETLNSAETVEFDETQKAIIENEIAAYFTADKVNSKMYVEVKAQRAIRNDRIKQINARLTDIDLEVEELSMDQQDKLKANLNNASQERKDKLAEISVQFKGNKKFLEQFSDQVESNVLYLDDEIVNKRRLIERLEKNELAGEQKEKAQKDLENLEKYRKFYKDVLQDNLLDKYKKLFGDTKKITGERINEINDQMQILFDVLESANREDIDDLIEKVENIANKIGKIEYTITLKPGEKDINVVNKKGVQSTYNESTFGYLQNQSTLFKVNYEVDGVSYTKVVDYNGLMDLYNLNLGNEMTNAPEEPTVSEETPAVDTPTQDAPEETNGMEAINNVDFDTLDQMVIQQNENAIAAEENNNNNTMGPTTAQVNEKILKVLKGRKSKIADKTKAENVAASLVIGGGLIAQLAAFTPLLASNPIGISVAIGAAAVYNRDKIKNMFVKSAERMKAKKIEKQLKKLCKEFNSSTAGQNQHEIAVRYDLNDHIAQIVRNTTGESDINGWTPITSEDAEAIVNGAGVSLQERVNQIFNTNKPSRTFINENGEEETIVRDDVRAENITTAFQLYGGVMNHGESYYDNYRPEELANAYTKAVNPVDIEDAIEVDVPTPAEETPEIENVPEETPAVEQEEVAAPEAQPTEEAPEVESAPEAPAVEETQEPVAQEVTPAEETVAAPTEEVPAVETTTTEPTVVEEAPATSQGEQTESGELTQEELAANVAEVLDEPQAPVLEGVNFPQPMNSEPVVENEEATTRKLFTDLGKKIKNNNELMKLIGNVIKVGEYTESPEITVIGQDDIQPSQSGTVVTPENAQQLNTEFVSENIPEEVDFKEAFEDVLLEAGLENADQIYDLNDEDYRKLIDTAETLLSGEANKIPVVITLIEQYRKDKSVGNDPELAGPKM